MAISASVGHLEPEEPICCEWCGGLYDLRFWCATGASIVCPECRHRQDIPLGPQDPED